MHRGASLFDARNRFVGSYEWALPFWHPMHTCAFGGDRPQRLFITSAEIFTDPGDLFAGTLFEIDAGVSGLGERRFDIT